jgi:hypothetical protein
MTASGVDTKREAQGLSPLIAEAAGGHAADQASELSPPPRQGARLAQPLRVFVTAVAALLLAALLNADHLSDRAGKKPFGGDRDFWLAAWEPFQEVSDRLYLNRPRQWLDKAVDRELTTKTFTFVAKPTPVAPAQGSAAPEATPVPDGAGPVSADTATGNGAEDLGAIHPPDLFGPVPTQRVRVPTTDTPLKLFAAGDSMAVAFGQSLSRLASATRLIEPDMDARTSSGLTRPDFFDWPARLNEIVANDNPDVVVVMFGANDSQGIRTPDGHTFQPLTDGWREEYRRRVAGTMDLLAAPGRLVIWVGQPIMASDGLTERMADVDTIYQDEASKRWGVVYFDSWPLFIDGSGKFDTFLPNADGALEAMRSGDGIHLTRAGADRLADAVLKRLNEETTIYP